MRISELSTVTGLSVPTIKFYIRRGLLPAGERTSKNQAEYGELHVERAELIRSLQAAGLSLDAIARSLKAAAAAKEHFLISAVDALERPARQELPCSEHVQSEARELVLRLTERMGWELAPEDGSLAEAVSTLAVIKQYFSAEEDLDALLVYGRAVDAIAALEVPEDWAPGDAPTEALRYALLGTVLFEPFILALRRMAHVSRVRQALRKRQG